MKPGGHCVLIVNASVSLRWKKGEIQEEQILRETIDERFTDLNHINEL